MPSNPPHHRSGAALYYNRLGHRREQVAARRRSAGRDRPIYEPSLSTNGPGSEPLTFPAFSINPQGVPAASRRRRSNP